MDPKQNRVLAYTLAKTIEFDDLTEVSGGGMFHTYHKITVITGGYGSNMDVEHDVTVDE